MTSAARIAAAAVAMGVVLAPAARAQTVAALEEELALAYGDRSMVSIATGELQPLRRAPAIATVITAEEIEAMGVVDLDELLEHVPGVHVSRAGNMYKPLYVMRGIHSDFNQQVLVLLNGVPMTTLLVGNRGEIWGGYPLEHIARVEVMRSPGSALHGADAFAGVINLVTKRMSEAQGTRVGARAGSFNAWDTWLLHGGTWGGMEAVAYLRVGRTDGHRRTIDADAQTFNDTLFGTNVSRAPGPINAQREALDAHLDLSSGGWRAHGGYKYRKLGTGAGVASALDPQGNGSSHRVNADLSWSGEVAPDWTLGASGSFVHYRQAIGELFLFPPGVTFPTGTFPDGMQGRPDTWERQWRLGATASYTGFSAHRIRLGAGYEDLDLYRIRELKNFEFVGLIPAPVGEIRDFSDTAPFIEPRRRKVWYAYAQDEWTVAKDWTLTAGLRHDRYSDFGHTTNPRLALVWDAAYNLTFKLMHGSAFRAPSFNETHSINNPVARGNPALEPETIRATELAASWQATPQVHAQFTIFRYAIKDIINAVANEVASTGATFQNTGRQRGRGIEAELEWNVDRSVRLVAHYTYQRATDERTGSDAGHAPRHDAYARADWRVASGWLTSLQLNHIAGRRRPAGDLRSHVPDYTTVDLTARSTGLATQWELVAGVRNLFDADVREPSTAPGVIPNDLPMPRRSFYLQAVHRF